MIKTKSPLRNPVPPILPREPMTKKARAAIEKYAVIKGKDLLITHFMVGYVLDAERMRRADLYAWLEKRNYHWNPQAGSWREA